VLYAEATAPVQKYGEWIVRNSEWIAIPFFVRSGIAQVPAFAVGYETRLAGTRQENDTI